MSFCIVVLKRTVTGTLRVSGLGGTCNRNRAGLSIVHGLGFSVRRKNFRSVVNPSNSNGDAFLRLITNLLTPSSNRVTITKRSLTNLGSGTLALFEHHRINLVFRSFGLVPALATRRGVTLPLLLSGDRTGCGTRMGRLVDLLKLRTEEKRLPRGLSNNRERHITVTETLTKGPSVILTSRPSNGLSSPTSRTLYRLLLGLGHRLNTSVLLIDRSPVITTTASGMRVLHSNTFISTFRARNSTRAIVDRCLTTVGWRSTL